MKVKKRIKQLPKASFGRAVGGDTASAVGGQIGSALSSAGSLATMTGVGAPVGMGLQAAGGLIGPIMSFFSSIGEIFKKAPDPLKKVKWEQTNQDGNYSFGNPQAKYGMPLFDNGGKIEPIYVSDKNDPRLKSYQDSLTLYKQSNQERVNNLLKQGFAYDTDKNKIQNNIFTAKDKKTWQKSIGVNEKKGLQKIVQSGNDGIKDNYVGGNKDIKKQNELVHGKIAPVAIAPLYDKWWRNNKYLYDSPYGVIGGSEVFKNEKNFRVNPNYGKPNAKDKAGEVIRNFFEVPIYKKPAQPVVYRKKETSVPVPKSTPVKQTTKSNKVEPIYVDNPNDPRLKAYKDSLNTFNLSPDYNKEILDNLNKANTVKEGTSLNLNTNDKYYKKNMNFSLGFNRTEFPRKTVNDGFVGAIKYDFKKPVQPIIYKKKEEVKVPVPKVNYLKNLPTEQDSKIDILGNNVQYQNEPTQETTKGKPLNDFLIQTVKTPNGMKIYKRKDTNSPFIEQYALGGFINKNKINNSLSNGLLNKMFSLNGKFFSSPGQYQQYQSLYNPQFQLQQPIMNNYGTLKMKSNFKNNSFFELGGDPRAQSNIEAEEGETMKHVSGKVETIGGKKHPQGGTPLQIQPSHEYIFSDSLGRDKNGNITLNEKDVVRSFADDSRNIERRYKGKENDKIAADSKKFELDNLKQVAEQARVAKEEIEMGKQMKKYKAKYGMTLKKYANSGFVFNQNDYIDWIKQNPEYTDKDHPIKDLNSITAKSIYRPMYAEHIYNQYGADAYNTVVDEFSKRPGGYTVGKDIDYNITQYDFPSDPTAPKSWANSGGRWTSDNPYKGVGIPGNYGGISEPLGGGVNPNPFIGPMMPSNRLPRGGFGPYPQGQIGTPKVRATASMDQRSTAPQVADKVKNGLFDSLTPGDKLGLAGMIPGSLYNIGMGLSKAEKEGFHKNPYMNRAMGIMANRKFTEQPFINQALLANNALTQDINNNSTSVGVRNSNLLKVHQNYMNQLADITGNAQQLNNAYRAEEAQTMTGFGETLRQEGVRQADINAKNQATKQNFLAKGVSQIGQGISTVGQGSNQVLTNQILAKALSEISPDFDIKDLDKVYTDKDGFIVYKGNKFTYSPDRKSLIPISGNIALTADAKKSQYKPLEGPNLANFVKIITRTE